MHKDIFMMKNKVHFNTSVINNYQRYLYIAHKYFFVGYQKYLTDEKLIHTKFLTLFSYENNYALHSETACIHTFYPLETLILHNSPLF